jgi:hypothetical protein
MNGINVDAICREFSNCKKYIQQSFHLGSSLKSA